MPHQNGAGRETTVATVARPKVVSLARWPLLQIADPIIPGSNLSAPTLLARTPRLPPASPPPATGPLLTLCRRLVEAGHDPSTPLEAYRARPCVCGCARLAPGRVSQSEKALTANPASRPTVPLQRGRGRRHDGPLTEPTKFSREARQEKAGLRVGGAQPG
jgi:hypothetical protein